MTLKSRSTLLAQANSDLPDNELKLISPADVRNLAKDIIDSMVSKNGDTGIIGLLQYNNTFDIDDDRQITHKKYVDDLFDSVEIAWADLTGLPSDNSDFTDYINANVLRLDGQYPIEGDIDFDGWDIVGLNNVYSDGDNDLGFYLNGMNRFNFLRSSSFANYSTFQIVVAADSGGDSQAAIMFVKPSGSAGILSGYTANSDLAFLAADTGVAGLMMVLKSQGMTLYGDIYDSSNVNRFAKIDNRVLVNQSGVDVLDFIASVYVKSGINFGIGGTDYQDGVGIQFVANSTTLSTNSPTGGVRIEIVNGTTWHKLPTDENICVAGRMISDADNYTQSIGDTTLIYTGTGGHTFTLHTAVGYKNSTTKILNRGSGSLTVNGGTLTSGSDLILISDNTNWI